jgi:hypothetical protein
VNCSFVQMVRFYPFGNFDATITYIHTARAFFDIYCFYYIWWINIKCNGGKNKGCNHCSCCACSSNLCILAYPISVEL